MTAPDASAARVRAGRATIAIAAAAALAIAYLATFQLRMYGDSVGLTAAGVAAHEQRHWLHFALRDGLVALGIDGGLALRLLSALAMAAGVVIAVHATRRASASLARDAAVLLLLAATPVCWFFGTTVEVHGLHFLGAAGAYALAVRASHAAPAARNALLALALTAPLVFHPLLALQAPALIALALPRGTRARTAALAASTALVLALPWVGRAIDASVAGALPGHFADLAAGLRDAFGGARGFPALADFAEHIGYELLLPLGVLTPLAVIALLRRAGSREERLALALAFAAHAWILPQLGVREWGAYGLGLVPFAFAAALRALEPTERAVPRARSALPLAATLAVAQLALGHWRVQSYARGGDDRAWIASVAAAVERADVEPQSAYVVTCTAPRWEQLLRDHGIAGFDARFVADRLPRRERERAAERAVETLRLLGAAGRVVLVDRGVLESLPGNEALPALARTLERRARLAPVEGCAALLRCDFTAPLADAPLQLHVHDVADVAERQRAEIDREPDELERESRGQREHAEPRRGP